MYRHGPTVPKGSNAPVIYNQVCASNELQYRTDEFIEIHVLELYFYEIKYNYVLYIFNLSINDIILSNLKHFYSKNDQVFCFCFPPTTPTSPLLSRINNNIYDKLIFDNIINIIRTITEDDKYPLNSTLTYTIT